MPFEGTGAVSGWTFTLPKAANRFDFNSISDVIVQIKYTALDGGTQFRDQVTSQGEIKTYSSNFILSMKHSFSSQWQSLINGQSTSLIFEMSESMLPTVNGDNMELGEILSCFVLPEDASVGITVNEEPVNDGKVACPRFETWTIEVMGTPDLKGLNDIYLSIPYSCALAW